MYEKSKRDTLKPVLLLVCNVSWFFVSHRLPIAVAAKKNGYRVVVCAASDAYTERITNAGCEFYEWRVCRGTTGVISEYKALRNLLLVIRSVKPDVLHLVTPKAIIYGGLIARSIGVKAVVLAISGQGHIGSSASFSSQIARAALGLTYRYILNRGRIVVIVQNQADKVFFLGKLKLPASKLRLIPGSGVNLDQYRPGNESAPPMVLMACRMLWSKGVAEFVQAAEVIKKKNIDASFVLAGKVDYDNPAGIPEPQLVSWDESGVIRWLGHVEKSSEIIREASIVCLPTTYGEGTPKVLLEAAACGKPIVATDWPGCDEAVVNGLNGFLFKPGDVAELVQKLELLIKDSKLRITFGEAGRKRAIECFSEESVQRATMEIYEDVLGETKK